MGSPHGNNMSMHNMTLTEATRPQDITNMTREVDIQGHQVESAHWGKGDDIGAATRLIASDCCHSNAVLFYNKKINHPKYACVVN